MTYRSLSPTQNQLQIDGDTTVKGTISSEYCHIGNGKDCMLQVVNDGGEDKMLITLPNRYNRTGKNNKETYDMRSIIESIQELNRRTSTISSNVSFLSAMETFDTSAEHNDMFTCDTHDDGLPAARMGEVDISSTKYAVKLCVDHEQIYTIDNMNLTGTQLSTDLDISIMQDLIDSLQEKLQINDGENSTKIVAFETIPHQELIDYTEGNKTVIYRVLTSFDDVGNWNYIYEPKCESITVSYNAAGDSIFSLNEAYQTPIIRLRLLSSLQYKEKEEEKTIPSGGIYSVNLGFTFADNHTLESIDLQKFDTRYVESMAYMFAGCKVLKTLNIPENIDTNRVTSMAGMFSYAYKLENLTLPSNFNTKNVTNMESMFANLLSLSVLNLPKSFNTKKVKDMSWMFRRDYRDSDCPYGAIKLELILTDSFIVDSQCKIERMFQVIKSAGNERSTHEGFLSIHMTYSLFKRTVDVFTEGSSRSTNSYFWFNAQNPENPLSWYSKETNITFTINYELNNWQEGVIYIMRPPTQ